MTVINWILALALIVVAFLIIVGVALTKHDDGKVVALNTRKGGAFHGRTMTADEKLTWAVSALAGLLAVLLMLTAAL